MLPALKSAPVHVEVDHLRIVLADRPGRRHRAKLQIYHWQALGMYYHVSLICMWTGRGNILDSLLSLTNGDLQFLGCSLGGFEREQQFGRFLLDHGDIVQDSPVGWLDVHSLFIRQ